ncbi:MAG: zinc-ribbon domain containing protein [Chloroflexi bacterium]|nr:zinc-ribbon domain containing protein [Chloroflexota bacterium]
MAFADRTLQCVGCGNEFVFSAQEQEAFAARGFTNDPKRCPACREARRSQRGEGDGGLAGERRPRQLYPAVCAECGADTQVPFQPRGDRPVYCSSCYSKLRGTGR